MDRTRNWMRMTPRVLSIAFTLSLALFSLDVFEIEASTAERLLALLMHNIPSLALALVTLLAWKRDLIGAAGFIGAGCFYIWMVASNSNVSPMQGLLWSLTIAGPALVIGLLYLINWNVGRKQKSVH